MRLLSRFLVHTPARFLEDEYSISYTTILRIDKEVLENDIPNPKMQNVQGVLVDEKFLGSSQDAKACGLFDVSYLFLKLRQVYFLRLQRKHKTGHSFYQQI